MNKISLSKSNLKSTFYQFIKFGIVGASNAIIQLAVYYLFLWMGSGHYLANTAGFLVSVVNAYIWNRLWVFKNIPVKNRSENIIKFFSIYLVTFLLSYLYLFIFVDLLNISDKLAPIIIICLNTPVNFLLQKVWTFKIVKE